MLEWTQLRRFYNYKITTKQVQLVRCHSQSLLSTNTADQSHPSPASHRRNRSDSTHTISYCNKPLSADNRNSLVKETNGGMRSSLRSVSFSSFQSAVTHDGHDCNGYALDPSRIRKPSESEVWSNTSMLDFDEAYTRRVLGFSSVDEMYKWVSCEKLLYQIRELPILITNALDDPLILRQCHKIPEKYTRKSTV